MCKSYAHTCCSYVHLFICCSSCAYLSIWCSSYVHHEVISCSYVEHILISTICPHVSHTVVYSFNVYGMFIIFSYIHQMFMCIAYQMIIWSYVRQFIIRSSYVYNLFICWSEDRMLIIWYTKYAKYAHFTENFMKRTNNSNVCILLNKLQHEKICDT